MEGRSTSTVCTNRLMSDWKRMKDDAPVGVSGAPREGNLMVWDAIISGPPETPWDGGVLKLTLEFKQDYPMTPPKVKFVSKMFHPNGKSAPLPFKFLPATSDPRFKKAFGNDQRSDLWFASSCAVYNDGRICLDILKNQWSPAYGVATILSSIQSLLCDPNPHSPANPEAARLYRGDREEYNKRVGLVVSESSSNIQQKI